MSLIIDGNSRLRGTSARSAMFLWTTFRLYGSYSMQDPMQGFQSITHQNIIPW